MTVNVNHSDDNAEGGVGGGYASSLYFPNPTPFDVTTTGIQQIKITWDIIETGDENVMVAYNTSNSFGTPVNQSTYSAGDAITGGGTVLCNGSVESYFHYNLNTGTTYYYEAWSIDKHNNYSSGTSGNTDTYANSYLDRYKGGSGDGNDSEITTDGPVPVELVSFAAKVKGTEVNLNWQTATEVNNYGFEVERNSNLEGFSTIGFIEGHGNSNSLKDYSFIATEVESGTIEFRLKQIDTDGSFEYSKIVEVEIDIPTEFKLNQNYPNPFNPSTTIQYSIPSVISNQASSKREKSSGASSPQNMGISNDNVNVNVTLKIYNLLGQEVATLVNEPKATGKYEVTFNATQLASGTYIYRISAGDFVDTKKLLLLK